MAGVATDTPDPIVASMVEAEWNPPKRSIGATAVNPFTAAVETAAKDGKAYSVTLDLESKEWAEQSKEIGKTLRTIRRAADKLDPPRSVAAYAGEVDKKANSVVLTFKVIDKIVRNTSNDDKASAE